MGITTPRKKPRNLLLSILYRMHQVLPMGAERKLRLYLDLEWIFDRLAMETSFRHYGPDRHPFRQHARAFLEQYIGRDDAVLDLGCAKGDMSAMLASVAREVVGVDHDAAAIAYARKTHTNANLAFHDSDALAYLKDHPKRFDVLILSHILEHLDRPEEFLKTFKDYFAYIYIELPDFDKTYLNLYRKDLGVKLIYTDDDHVSEFDRLELRAILDRLGIRIEAAEYRFGIQRLWCRVQQDG